VITGSFGEPDLIRVCLRALTANRGDGERFGRRRTVLLFVLIVLAMPALGRNDGRYANSPLKSWFETLKSDFGQCCTVADGYIALMQIGNPIAGIIASRVAR
jgi:hypothetical protein